MLSTPMVFTTNSMPRPDGMPLAGSLCNVKLCSNTGATNNNELKTIYFFRDLRAGVSENKRHRITPLRISMASQTEVIHGLLLTYIQKTYTIGAPGWHRQLSIWLLVSAQVMISRLRGFEPPIGLYAGNTGPAWDSLSLSLSSLSLSLPQSRCLCICQSQ